MATPEPNFEVRAQLLDGLLLHAYMTLVQVPDLIRTNRLHEAEALVESSRKVMLGLWPDTAVGQAIRGTPFAADDDPRKGLPTR